MSDVQGLMTVMQPRGERWTGSGFPASPPLQQKQIWDPLPRPARLPWVWSIPPLCMLPHCPLDLLGRACSLVRISAHMPLAYGSCISFTTVKKEIVPHFSREEDRRERGVGASPCPCPPGTGARKQPLAQLVFLKGRAKGSAGSPELLFCEGAGVLLQQL